MTQRFRTAAFLLDHARRTLAFYSRNGSDPLGGFAHVYLRDGSVGGSRRHLVSSAQFVSNYALAYTHFGAQADLDRVHWGLRFLREVHRHGATGGYAWELDLEEGRWQVCDSANYAEGLARVLIAYVHAHQAGAPEARPWIDETWDLLERHFWEPQHGLYANERSADWSVLGPYRGQSVNLHLCEALLAACEAGCGGWALARAELLARNVVVRQAALAHGLVCEHYHADWSLDLDSTAGAGKGRVRACGAQPGHLMGWSRVLLQLERHRAQLACPAQWLLPAATRLFDAALAHGWQAGRGGLCNSVRPDGAVSDADQYYWAQAAGIGAAAALAVRTGQPRYWSCYERLWQYCWENFIDHEHGAWWRKLDGATGRPTGPKNPAPKTDYPAIAACLEMARTL